MIIILKSLADFFLCPLYESILNSCSLNSSRCFCSGTNTRMPASQAPNPSQQHLQANRFRTEFDINRIRTEFDINRIQYQQHLQANRIRYQQLLQSFYSYQQDRVRMRRRLAGSRHTHFTVHNYGLFLSASVNCICPT